MVGFNGSLAVHYALGGIGASYFLSGNGMSLSPNDSRDAMWKAAAGQVGGFGYGITLNVIGNLLR